MSINYYLITELVVCPTCNHAKSEPRLHIGKSSGGWCFSLRVYPEKGIHDLVDWMEIFSGITDHSGSCIENEYGARTSPIEMISTIVCRKTGAKWDQIPFGYSDWKNFHALNHSEQGPDGLLRHKVDGHCVRHGSGTWDCMVGEFT